MLGIFRSLAIYLGFKFLVDQAFVSVQNMSWQETWLRLFDSIDLCPRNHTSNAVPCVNYIQIGIATLQRLPDQFIHRVGHEFVGKKFSIFLVDDSDIFHQVCSMPGHITQNCDFIISACLHRLLPHRVAHHCRLQRVVLQRSAIQRVSKTPSDDVARVGIEAFRSEPMRYQELDWFEKGAMIVCYSAKICRKEAGVGSVWRLRILGPWQRILDVVGRNPRDLLHRPHPSLPSHQQWCCCGFPAFPKARV